MVGRYRKRAGIKYPQSTLYNYCYRNGADQLAQCMPRRPKQKRPRTHNYSIVLNVSQPPFHNDCLQFYIFVIEGAHQNTLEVIPLILVTYVYHIPSSPEAPITDFRAGQALPDSNSQSTLHLLVRSGPSLAFLILVGMLQETPRR